MRLIVYILFTSLITLIACGSQTDKGDRTGYCITIDIAEDLPPMLIDTVTEVPLVTPPGLVVGELSKFLSYNDHFFIMDQRTHSLWKFNKDGHYLGHINNIGPGPAEYQSIRDFDIDNAGIIHILDLAGGKILCYSSENLAYLGENKFPGHALAFCAIDSTGYYFNRAATGNDFTIKLGIYHKGDNEIKSLISTDFPDEFQAVGSNPSYLWRSDSTVAFYNRFTSDIYTIRRDSILKFATLKSDNIPTSEQVARWINKGQKHDYSIDADYFDISGIYFLDSGVFVTTQTLPKKYLYYNFADSKTYTISSSPHMYGVIRGAIGVFNNHFVTFRMPQEDDNPSIVLYKITEKSSENSDKS